MLQKLKSLAGSRWLLIIILIIASFLRLYNLTELPLGLYQDEAMNGNNAQEALDTGNFKVFYPENFGREGLFINIQALFISQFGHKQWALRLPSAIFGILTVLGLYFFTSELFSAEKSSSPKLRSRSGHGVPQSGTSGGEDKQASLAGDERSGLRKEDFSALFAAFLLATSFWHVIFSRIGFRAIMAPFFLVWAVYFLLKSLNSKQQILYAIAGGLVYGLGFYSYIAYRITPLLIATIGFLFWRNSDQTFRKSIIKIFSVFLIAAFLTALPLGIYFLQHPADFFGRTANISVFNSSAPLFNLGFNIIKTSGMFNIAGDFNWRHNFAGRPELFLPVGIFLLLGIYESLKKIKIKKLTAVPELVIFSWFLTAMLPIVISNEGLPHALRSILLIPPVFILSAIGGMKVYDWFRSCVKPQRLRLLGYIFCAILFFESAVVYFIAWANHTAVHEAFAYKDYVVADHINSLPREIIKYIVVKDARGNIERDYPIALQSILFLTDTFSKEKRAEKNIIYIPADQFKKSDSKLESAIIQL